MFITFRHHRHQRKTDGITHVDCLKCRQQKPTREGCRVKAGGQKRSEDFAQKVRPAPRRKRFVNTVTPFAHRTALQNAAMTLSLKSIGKHKIAAKMGVSHRVVRKLLAQAMGEIG